MDEPGIDGSKACSLVGRWTSGKRCGGGWYVADRPTGHAAVDGQGHRGLETWT